MTLIDISITYEVFIWLFIFYFTLIIYLPFPEGVHTLYHCFTDLS